MRDTISYVTAANHNFLKPLNGIFLRINGQYYYLGHSIFAFDLKLLGGNTISSPGGIVCLVSPKKSYELNSLGEN